MKKYKYAVVGIYINGDCEVEGIVLDTYKDALKTKREWELEERYVKVYIDRLEENPS